MQPKALGWPKPPQTAVPRPRPAPPPQDPADVIAPREEPWPSDLMQPGQPQGGGPQAAAAHRQRASRVGGPAAAIVPPRQRATVVQRLVDSAATEQVATVHRVHIKPGMLELTGAWPELGPAMVGTTLCLSLVTQVMLAKIPDERFYDLLDQLGASRQIARWHAHHDKRHRSQQKKHWLAHRTRRAEVSGVSALTLRMWSLGETQGANRLLLGKPVEVALDLADAVPALFTLENISQIFLELIPRITSPEIEWNDPEDEQINAMGTMIQAFLTVHAKEQPALVEGWVVALMQHLERAGFETSSENLGLLAGVVLAGAYKYARAIHAFDQRRYKFIDKTSLFLFASAGYVPIVPVAATFSVLTVATGILLEKYFPVRDFSKFVSQLEGRLRVRLLKLKIYSSPSELPMLMQWLVGALRCNDLTE